MNPVMLLEYYRMMADYAYESNDMSGFYWAWEAISALKQGYYHRWIKRQ